MDISGSTARFLFRTTGSDIDAAVVTFEGREGVSRPFEVTVHLAAHSEIPSLADLLGLPALLTIVNEVPPGDPDQNRYIHGIVRTIAFAGLKGNYFLYDIELVPAVWRLSLRTNCRIFQETTTEEIVRTILEEAGFCTDDFRFALVHPNRPRGFCVQYRESDFDFICRLLQEEGIFYFFDHGPERAVIVFGDDGMIHPLVKGDGIITFKENAALVAPEETIHSFSYAETMTPTAFSHRNFFFKRTSLDLTSQAKQDAKDHHEIYDYPGRFVTPEQGKHLAKVRLQEQTAKQKVGEGRGSSTKIVSGYAFALAGHPTGALNQKYVVLEARHHGEQSQSLEELAGSNFTYENSFTVVPFPSQFRPPCALRKPLVRGLQTAIVVGPPGERVYTDQYGRVKVRFHWDRNPETNERSSCWLRAGQGWGGCGWGMLFTPRVGDEVLVDFLEGDPDRPLIVGSVYNERNLPPYELPTRKTVSTIKTRSYPDGTGFNELRFEDRKGSEEIYLHGEKDCTIGIENDKNQSVGRDETLTVGNNRHKEIGGDQKVTVGANHTEMVGGEKSVSVGRNRNLSVTLDATETVGMAKMVTTGGLYQVSVGGAMNETVGGAKAEEVGLAKSVLVGGRMAEKVEGNRSLSVGKDFTTEVAGKNTVRARAIVIEADDEIVLRSGSATIALKSSGDILISGQTVQCKGAGDVVIKGGRISEN